MSEGKAPNLSADQQAIIREETLYGRLPLLPEEREYGTLGANATCFAYAVATWCFLEGGYMADYLGAVDGLICLVTGSLIGLFLVTMAPALAGQRYGVEAIDYTKTAFGQRGSRVLLVFYLLFRDHQKDDATRNILNRNTEIIVEITTLIRERLPRDRV